MATTRSRTGAREPSERKHVGMTLPRPVKEGIQGSAAVLEWSTGDWVLAMAAEHGPALTSRLGHLDLPRRSKVDDATFTALYLTPDERDEIDDQARACGLNRSAFVTAVSRLGMGHQLDDVVATLRGTAPTATAKNPPAAS